MSEQFLFISLGLLALIGGGGILVFKHPVQAALSMLLCVLSISGLFALLSASFLFMIQIIIYAGAVIVLLMFIIMFLNLQDKHLPNENINKKVLFFYSLFLIPINYLILKEIALLPGSNKPLSVIEFADIKSFGEVLFNKWLVPFELISVLLLAVVVAAVVLAKRNRV